MYEALKVIILQGGHDFVTDRQANGQTEARGKHVSRPFQGGGGGIIIVDTLTKWHIMCLHRLPKYSFIELSVSKGLTEGNNPKGSEDIDMGAICLYNLRPMYQRLVGLG